MPPLVESLEEVLEKLVLDDEEALDQANDDHAARRMVDAFMALHETSETPLNSYVQIVTDTPSVNAKAWSLIEEESPHLLANPCIFHCINLFFKHNIKGDKSDRADPRVPIPEFEDAEAWTKELEQFFTNVEMPRACLLKRLMSSWATGGLPAGR